MAWGAGNPSAAAATARWLKDAEARICSRRSVTNAVRSWGLDGGSVSIVTRHRRASSKMLGSLFVLCTKSRDRAKLSTHDLAERAKSRIVTRVGRVSMANEAHNTTRCRLDY